MEDMKKYIAEFQNDFDKQAAKGVWDDNAIRRMKDLQKLMYYMEVRCAMKEGNDYPGSEHMPETSRMTYAKDRNSMWPSHPYYDDQRTSSRRYYDSEKEKAIHKLHHMMENTDNMEQKNALKLAITELEQR